LETSGEPLHQLVSWDIVSGLSDEEFRTIIIFICFRLDHLDILSETRFAKFSFFKFLNCAIKICFGIW
jgi:hypothetical protein